jgi:hypothetical protein
MSSAVITARSRRGDLKIARHVPYDEGFRGLPAQHALRVANVASKSVRTGAVRLGLDCIRGVYLLTAWAAAKRGRLRARSGVRWQLGRTVYPL